VGHFSDVTIKSVIEIMEEIEIASLRDSLLNSIGRFLFEEGFTNDGIIHYGILEAINLISDYHEEGNALFPEILVTNNLETVKTSILHNAIVIHEAVLSAAEFKNAIKLCAPLAKNSWIIFIEIKDNKIKYGLISAEITETSPSMYSQTVGELKVDLAPTTIAYIRNIGQKTVELAGLKKKLIVSLNLDITQESALDAIKKLCGNIIQDCDEKYKGPAKTFFEKTIDKALKTGHGNLIAIVKEDEAAIAELKSKISGVGGIYLSEPIDFQELIIEAEESKSNEDSVSLKSHASIFKSMLNHDGITIISTSGRILGYHIIIDSKLNGVQNELGGTRSKAFQAMQDCNLFQFCFFKSQDGQVKTWEKK